MTTTRSPRRPARARKLAAVAVFGTLAAVPLVHAAAPAAADVAKPPKPPKPPKTTLAPSSPPSTGAPASTTSPPTTAAPTTTSRPAATTAPATTAAPAAPTSTTSTPITTPIPVTSTTAPASRGGNPAGVLDLTNWKLTLPIDTPHAGSPDEIRQPELATFADAAYFHVAGSAVVFTAPIQGATTSGSGYPRSELREMANGGKDNASWSSTSGSHSMTVTEAITHTPVVKPHVVAAQIHDASDDVVMVRLEGKHLFVEHDGTNLGDLDVNYQLGAYFTVRITATGGQVTVDYNGVPKVHYQAAGSGWYFKAGAYTQSNLSKGDAAGAYGEVAIKGLTVTHS